VRPSRRASLYAELDRPRDARRELEALARHDFTDITRDWMWQMTIAALSEVVALLDDARRAELLYQLLLLHARRQPVTPMRLDAASGPCRQHRRR
jgi:hypothetical protein